MIEVTQEKLEDAIRQYGSINAVLDNESLKPFWVEWDLDSFYEQLVQTVQFRFSADQKNIHVGNTNLYPIMVGRRDLTSTVIFAIQAAHEDDEGVYRNVGSVCEFWIDMVAKRPNGDWLKITPQYCVPQALDYLNMLIAKLEETFGARFKHLNTVSMEEPANWAEVKAQAMSMTPPPKWESNIPPIKETSNIFWNSLRGWALPHVAEGQLSQRYGSIWPGDIKGAVHQQHVFWWAKPGYLFVEVTQRTSALIDVKISATEPGAISLAQSLQAWVLDRWELGSDAGYAKEFVRAGGRWAKGSKPNARRDAEIFRLHCEDGQSYGKLAMKYQVSDRRIKQIVKEEKEARKTA